MREIKFRTWDKRFKKMVDVFKIIYYDKSIGMKVTVLYRDKWNNTHYPELEPEDVILMQYTGLKDKNGKEIYEGDILKDTKYKKPVYYEVGFAEGCFFYKYLKTNTYRELWRKNETCEVIGNIYENSELIE